MTTHIVLYRKYRPRRLEEVFGQDHVKQILTNAIKSNQVAHAYLFTGPRGTGKTSVARILASELGISGVDVVEIDAASHRGIDRIRELRESVGYMPTQGTRKIYILDEVHMLTSEAFNALLKTLEEPPSHVYFVLCTTEPHQIPLTVISRCQQLNFELADDRLMTEYVQHIANTEGVQLSDEVAQKITQHASGSYRDALVIMENIMGQGGGDRINPRGVDKMLGGIEESETVELLNKLLQGDNQAVLLKLKQLGESGTVVTYILDRMIELLADVVLGVDGRISQGFAGSNVDPIRVLEGLIRARERSRLVTRPEIPFLVEIAKLSTGDLPVKVDSQDIEVSKSRFRGLQEDSNTLTPVEKPLSNRRGGNSINDQPNQQTSPQTGEAFPEWESVLEIIRGQNHGVEALLKGCKKVELVPDGGVHLYFAYEFHKRKIEEPTNREIVSSAIRQVLQRDVPINCLLASSRSDYQDQWDRNLAAQGDSAFKQEARPLGVTTQPEGEVDRENRVFDGDDLLKVAQEVFGGQVIE